MGQPLDLGQNLNTSSAAGRCGIPRQRGRQRGAFVSSLREFDESAWNAPGLTQEGSVRSVHYQCEFRLPPPRYMAEPGAAYGSGKARSSATYCETILPDELVGERSSGLSAMVRVVLRDFVRSRASAIDRNRLAYCSSCRGRGLKDSMSRCRSASLAVRCQVQHR